MSINPMDLVARMERSGIREIRSPDGAQRNPGNVGIVPGSHTTFPDFTSLHPGYKTTLFKTVPGSFVNCEAGPERAHAREGMRNEGNCSRISLRSIRATVCALSRLRRFKNSGFTLIEMIVTTVVVSIVAVALFGVFTTNVAHSADPMLRMQATAIGQGYLEEAMLKAFTDPDGGETNSCEGGETRPTYDDVLDYNCVSDVGARDQFGNAMPELAAYDVTMAVNPAALLGMHEIIVTVDHNGQTLITLTGYRANY